MYHRIACWYPNAHWHTFREGCHAYPLRIGRFEYHRSYEYIGIASSLLYYPFWRLWNSQGSEYLLGIICLAAFSFGMVRALRVPVWSTLIAFGYFPIVAMVIHDTGPIRLALLSVPALAWIARRAAMTESWALRLGYAVAAAACVVVCLEDKAFYAQLTPLIGACVAACLWHSDSEWSVGMKRRFAAWVGVAGVLCAAGSAVLLTARSGGHRYWSDLTATSSTIRRSIGFELSESLLYTALVPRFGNRMFVSGPMIRLTMVAWVAGAAVFVACAWRTRVVNRRAAVLFLGAYAVGVITFVASRMPASPHHFVFLHVPLLALLMVAGAGSGPAFARVMTFVGLSTLSAIALLSESPVAAPAARERAAMFAYLSRPDVAPHYVVNFSSWGGYYPQSLYGDRQQIVTFIAPANASDAARLVDIAKATSRDILDVCLDCDRAPIAEFLGPADIAAVNLGLTQWNVFRIAVARASQ